MDSVDSTSGLPGGNAPAHWYDTWDRQASQTFSTTTKGLRNAPGENNCFLNSAVQVFWHIDVFRRSYRRLSGHLCMGHSCIFCALKVIFTQFQYSDQSSLQPNALRKALANTFEKQERFKLGHMDDAAECFENILLRIHYHIANTHNEDTCNAAHCIPHQKFAMTVCDQLVCPCGSMSEPLKFHEMVHYISANALVSQARIMQESGDCLHPSRFGLLLRNAAAIGNIRDCPSNCGRRVQIRRTLTNVPDVVSIGLVWGSDKPDPELTTEVARNIGTTILLPDICHSVMCNDVSKLPRLHLTSVVCYYGKHYSTFVWHTKLQAWVFFDDATVRQVGTEWEQVVEKIVRSRYQPLLLIYTNLNANPVATETAPSTRVMAPGYSMNQEKNLSADHKSGSDKLNSKRSQKVDLSVNQEIVQSDLERKSSFEHRRQSSFLLAVTKQKHKEEAIYAVPHNNSKVVNSQKETSARGNPHGFVPGQGSGFTNIPEGQDVPDGYNYTLSNSDQYRRPGLSSPDPNNLPLTPNFSRVGETQRKESFKKGKGTVPADVIRYHSDPTRRSSVSSESDPGSPVHKGGKFVSDSNKPALPVKPKHFRTRSQSLEENLADCGANSQHKVIKPVVSGSNMYEHTDSITRAHTPVQSGLATLPRKKKSSNNMTSSIQSSSSSSSVTLSHKDNRPGSQHLMAAIYPHDAPPPPYAFHNTTDQQPLHHSLDSDVHSRQSSSSSILSQGTVIECPQGNSSSDNTHYRQSSSASQDTLTDKPKEKSKSKKDKDEKKKEDRKQRKEEKKHKSKKDKDKNSQNSPSLPEKEVSANRDEGYGEDQAYYIDRKMVESVLSFQKLQRSGSCLSHTSNSSLDSDLPNRGVNSKDQLSEIPFDQASLDSHKDSGYGSSDRNSSSSTGSITMNPYEQYFLSRSMIPPKTFNYQVMAENMQKLMNQGGSGMNGLEYTQESDLKSLAPNPKDQQYNNPLTVGHCQQAPPAYQHQYSRAPEDGYKGILNGEQKDKVLFDSVSGRNKSITPVPPYKNGSQGHPGQHPFTGHPSEGQFQPQGQLARDQQQYKEENEQFIGHCSTAEDLMDSCVLSETSEQYADALSYCQSAIDNLKIAMRLPNIGQSSYTFAQKKSNSCLLKSRSLQKRLYNRQESNGSTNSSDSVALDNRAARNHPPLRSQHQPVPSNGIFHPPSRSSSQNSVDSLKDSSVTSSGGSVRSNTPVHDKERRPPVEERVPPMHGHNPYGDRSFENNCPPGKSGDVFGTIPRWQTQRSQDHVRMCNNQKQEEEVYQDFIDNQRRQNASHSRTSSGAHTPVNEPEFVIVNSNLQPASAQGYYRTLQHQTGPSGVPNVSPKQTAFSQQQSQPDLNKLKSDIHPPTTLHKPSVAQADTVEDNQTVSVRDLKSRFEKQDVKSDISNTNLSSGHPSLGRVNSEQFHQTPLPLNPPTIQRQRSKSESESQLDAKPKSVLSKRGKHGEKASKPRKSVTFFSNDICLETGTELKSRDDGESTSSGSPVEIVGDRACMLCHKLGVEVGQSYCEKCTYYMGRFAPS